MLDSAERGGQQAAIAETWVLKAPMFTPFLGELAAVFPDAAFVFTSREPKSVLPSTCGMAEAAASVKMDYSDPARLSHLGASCADRFARFGQGGGEARLTGLTSYMVLE